MKLLCICVLFAFSLTGLASSADGQVSSVTCGPGLTCTPNPITSTGSIQAQPAYILCVKSGSSCSGDGFDINSYGTYQFIYAQGYNQPGDAGAGTFANMLVSGVNCTNQANGGTIVADNATSPNCFRRLDPNWGPREFGAKGDGSDDHAALRNWLNASQPHLGDVGTYTVSSPLDCSVGTTIQGPSNLAGKNETPLFNIVASSTFAGLDAGGTTQAVLAAHDYCRLSGVGIVANPPISKTGNTHSNMTIDNLVNVTGINLGNAVAGSMGDIPANTSVTGITSSPCCSVTISNNASGTNAETITFSSPISLPGTITNGSAQITFSSSYTLSGIEIGNAVTDTGQNITASSNTSVSEICTSSGCTGTGMACSPTPCVQVSASVMCSTCSSDTIIFWGPNAVDAPGTRVTIDGASALISGHYNFYCIGGNSVELKNSEFINSLSDNINLGSGCSNARVIGDVVQTAGNVTIGDQTARGVVFGGADLTVADGVIEESNGTGLDLKGANRVSVNGMFFNYNGTANGNAAILVASASTISICGNHIDRSGKNTLAGGTSPGTSQILFSGSISNVSLCGNVYESATNGPECGGMTGYLCWPQFVYDAVSGTTFQSASLYENPETQAVGVVSPTAAAGGLLPQYQVLPVTKSFITGLSLSNGGTSTKVNIYAGSATDSTGVMVITLQGLPACTVDLGSSSKGLGYIDDGGPSTAGTTYFFFAVADLSGEATPNCMASASLTPDFTYATSYGKGVFRLIGALYTTNPGNTVVPFSQDNDTFYLKTPVSDINVALLGNTDTPFAVGSVPDGIAVEWLGRCVGGTAKVIVYNPNQTPGTPAGFPAVPGYDVTNTAPDTAEKYQVWTDTAQHIHARASVAVTTFRCMTDGWVLDRSQ